MTINQRRKGANAEREAASVMSDVTLQQWDRRLGEGRDLDMGDLKLIRNDIYCVQVKSYSTATGGFASGRADVYKQGQHLANYIGEPVFPFVMFKFPRLGWLLGWRNSEDSHRYIEASVQQWDRTALLIAAQGVTVQSKGWIASDVSRGWDLISRYGTDPVEPK